jgi:hypothetical protein
MKYYTEQEYYKSQESQEEVREEYGCSYCWDRRKNKEKELFFLDNANNMRICNYCPSCGRKYNEE